MTSNVASSLSAAAAAGKPASEDTPTQAPRTRRASERKPYYLQVRIDPSVRKRLDLLCAELETNRTTLMYELLGLALNDADVTDKLAERL